MKEIKRGGTSIILFLLVLTIFFISINSVEALTFLNDDDTNDTVLVCPLGSQSCSCNDNTGIGNGGLIGALRCDNADYPDTLESSMTIDDCKDGGEVAPFEGTDNTSFYEYVQNIQIIDKNTTYLGGIRIGEEIEITITYICSGTSDAYSILYKNNTNSNDDWQVLDYGVCDASISTSVYISTIKKIDSVIGSHTIRALNGWGQPDETVRCGSDLDVDYSDTDDLIFEVNSKIDFEEPEIIINYPLEGKEEEFTDESQEFPINITINDQTGIDFVSMILSHDGFNRTLNVTNISNNYYATITNLTGLGLYEIFFYANDTLKTNESNGIFNHVNNYTSTFFYLKNDAGIQILNPGFNNVYSNSSVLLDFIINDILLPYSEVYFLFNNLRTNITDSKFTKTTNESINFINNSENNLSQSFKLGHNTTILHIGLKVKRNGDLNSNSTIFLIENSSGPFGTILAKGSLQNISNVTLDWVKFELNDTINITENTSYWITLNQENNSDYLEWYYGNNYSEGYYYNNNSIDLNLKIFEAYNYEYMLNSNQGLNTIKACENNTQNQVECSYTQYKIDLSPPYFTNPSFTSQVELGNLQTIILDVKDAISTISKVLLNFNNTNISMAKMYPVTYGWKYKTILNLTELKTYNFSIFANDSMGWSNITQTYFFSVNDTLAPTLTNITIYPTNSNIVDPNVTIFVNFSLFDYSNIDSPVYLQVRPNTTSIWTNISSEDLGDGNYKANFTPDIETKYYYRINAKDSENNELNSTTQSIDVLYERTWYYTPLSFEQKQVNTSETINLYNITIKNTGDVTIPFEIEKVPTVPEYDMFFSNSSFNLTKNSSILINLNITTPSTKSDNLITKATITCLANCNVKSATVGDSVVVGGEGPFLQLEIMQLLYGFPIPLEYTILKYNDRDNPEPYYLIAEITNIAEYYEATNITFNYIFPNVTGWIATINNTENLTANFSLGKSSEINSSKQIGIYFYIDRTTDLTKLYNLSINASLYYNGSKRTFTKILIINVSDTEVEPPLAEEAVIPPPPPGTPPPKDPPSEPKITNTDTTPTGGMGGGTLLTYNLRVFMDKTIDLLRGTNKTIQVNITNPYKNKYFSDITWNFNGYYNNQIFSVPDRINRLDFNETKTINITFNAPSYLGYSVNKVSFIFDYGLVQVGYNDSFAENLTTISNFTLVVNEVNRDDSLKCLEKSMLIVRNASDKDYNIEIIEDLLDKQKIAIASMDFTLAEKLCDEIEDLDNEMKKLIDKINLLNEKINTSNNKGYYMDDVIRLYNISNKYLISGDYDSLDDSLSSLENAYLLQIQLEDSYISKRLKKFINNNLKEIFLFLVIFSIVSFYTYKKTRVVILHNKIKNLKQEKISIGEKIKNLQYDYFNTKKVGKNFYTLHYDQYKDRFARINDDLLFYQSQHLNTNSKNLDNLKIQENNANQMLKELQQHYYIDNLIDKKSYGKNLTLYKKNLAKIRKEVMILESKKPSRLSEELKKDKEIFKQFQEKLNPIIFKIKKVLFINKIEAKLKPLLEKINGKTTDNPVIETSKNKLVEDNKIHID